MHQGIAARSFERQFNLEDHVEVEGASSRTACSRGWQTSSCFGAKWRPYEIACCPDARVLARLTRPGR